MKNCKLDVVGQSGGGAALPPGALGAALAGPEGLPATDVVGPAMPPVVQEPPMPPKAEPLVPEPTSPKVGAGMDGSAHSFQGYGRKVSADGGDPTFCWSL